MKRMTKKELLALHKNYSHAARELMKVKNNDYAGSGGTTPFANFTMCEASRVCTTEQGLLVRLLDKMARLATFAQDGKLLVKSENVEDTLLDIINYAILFGAYVRDKERCNGKDEESLEQVTLRLATSARDAERRRLGGTSGGDSELAGVRPASAERTLAGRMAVGKRLGSDKHTGRRRNSVLVSGKRKANAKAGNSPQH